MKNIQYKVIKWLFSLFAAIAVLCCIFLIRMSQSKNMLNPEEPVLITLWHYRQGSAKVVLDALIEQFNDTTGLEQGIVVEAVSFGQMSALESALLASAQNEMGSDLMPDLFTAYNDFAFQIDTQYGLADLEQYFTQEELATYNQGFLENGRFGEGHLLKNFPIAKSTECIYLNKTDFDTFSKDTGARLSDLYTWDGILHTAALYYQWSGGNPFFGIQDLKNSIAITGEIERKKNGISSNTSLPEEYYSKDAARRIWNTFCIPRLKGYYAKGIEETQSMTLVKTGQVLMVIASTAGATYMPDEVWTDEVSHHPIKCQLLPYPYYTRPDKYLMIRGNSCCVTKSDSLHEYASFIFLKWFTQKEQNASYAISTGYLPVKNETLTQEALQSRQATVPLLQEAQALSLEMLHTYQWFAIYETKNNTAFESAMQYQCSKQLELYEAEIKTSLTQGVPLEQLLSEFDSEEHFQKWYSGYLKLAEERKGESS